LLNYIVVFFGAGVGGMLRYWGSAFVYKFLPTNFPYGTLFVNVLGSFLIGIFMYYFDANELLSVEMRVFLTTGLCGGLTTFSTFSYETINFMKEGEFLFASINIIVNVLLTIVALFLAYKISKLLSGV
jgi:fluoride exporter